MPGFLGLKVILWVSPRSTCLWFFRKSISPAWKSIECGNVLDSRLVRENSIVSPSVARTTGPGNCPLKVQALYFVPLLSTTTSVSTAVNSTLTVLASARTEAEVQASKAERASVYIRLRTFGVQVTGNT